MNPSWSKRLSRLVLGCMMFSLLFANPMVAAAATKMLSDFTETVLTKDDVAGDVYLSRVFTLDGSDLFYGVFASPSEYEFYYGTSRDLVNWELKSKHFALVHGNGIFVGVSSGFPNQLYYMKDGDTWKTARLPEDINPMNVKFENGYFKLTAWDEESNMRMFVSQDAETWYDLTDEIPEGASLDMVISANGKLYALAGTSVSGNSLRVYEASSVGEERTAWNEIASLRKEGFGLVRKFFFDGETVGVQLYSLAEYEQNYGYVSNTLYYVTKDFINWEEKDWTEGGYDRYSPYTPTSTDARNPQPVDSKRFEALEILGYIQKGEDWPSEFVTYIVHSEDGVEWLREQVNIYVGGEKVGSDPAGRQAYIPGLGKYEWARKGAEYAEGRGYFSAGWWDDAYGADITRGNYLALIMQALNVPEPEQPREGYVPFEDVWYKSEWIERANRLGLVNGVGNNQFAPDDPIKRQDMMVMTYNILLKLGKIEADENLTALKAYKDADQVSGYAKVAVSSLLKAGIITGANGYVNPKGHVSNAEAVLIAERLNKYRFR